MRRTIGLLGGTGPEGLGLARRLAAAGNTIVIGSRDPARAIRAAVRVRDALPTARIRGTTNAETAAASQLVFLTLPFDGVDRVLEDLQEALSGKIVVEVTNPLRLRDGRFEIVPLPEGSAAEHIRCRLPEARIVSGLKTNSADSLARLRARIAGHVLMCGDDGGAKAAVRELVEGINGHVLDVGSLAMARDVEHVAAMLLNLNRRFQALTSVRIVGLPAGVAGRRRE